MLFVDRGTQSKKRILITNSSISIILSAGKTRADIKSFIISTAYSWKLSIVAVERTGSTGCNQQLTINILVIKQKGHAMFN